VQKTFKNEREGKRLIRFNRIDNSGIRTPEYARPQTNFLAKYPNWGAAIHGQDAQL
jgi:hypothetical protein